MVDMVNRPPHYMVGGIEAIDVIKSRLTKEGPNSRFILTGDKIK